MVLEFKDINGGVTLLLSGPDAKELKDLKHTIKHAFTLIQHLWLEKDLLIANNYLIRTIKVAQYTKNLSTIGNFNELIDRLMPNPIDFINSVNIVYTKINYVRANYQFYNDIESN